MRKMDHRIVSVTEFKAKCSALLEDVGTTGSTITITKRGRPVATVGPAHKIRWKSPEGAWKGKVIVRDEFLVSGTAELWDVVQQPRRGVRR